MWGYYGSKSKIIDLYPEPKFDIIIEPFAGTAQYALKYWDRDVILIDKYPTICNLWKWLQGCSREDILQTRRLEYGQSTDDFEWDCQERKDLVGFIIGGAPTMPKKHATKWKTVLRPNTQNFKLGMIADNLDRIRHWQIIQGDYTDSPDIPATWFVDPPYVVGGRFYKFGSKLLDYGKLAEWCRSRKGQTIVCEAENQDWLPFTKLTESRGNKYKHKEYIWTNEQT